MNNMFKIEYFKPKPLQDATIDFSEEEYVDASLMFLSLEHFLAMYQGTFILKIADFDLRFDLDPDLSTIFEEIPDVLMSLAMEEEPPVELYFYEQGTDLNLLLERKGSEIMIRFVKGLMVGKRFKNLPETPLSVPASIFLDEWSHFLHVILESLIELNPSLQSDESYLEYYSRLLAVDHASRKLARREQNPFLWTDAQQKRYFLIPEYALWPKGSFILRTFTGQEQSIDPAGLSNFEMTPQQAQQYVQAQMNQALEQTKSAFANLWGIAAQQAVPKQLSSPPLNELLEKPEVLEEWLGNLFGDINTFLHSAGPIRAENHAASLTAGSQTLERARA